MRARTSRFDTTAGWVCKAALVLLVGALVASKAVAEGGTSAKADESKSASEADVKRFEGFSKSVLEQLNKHKVLWREKLNARYAHLGDRGRSAGSWSELAVRQFDEHGWVVAEALMSVSGVLEQDGPGEWATRDLKKLNAELAALEAIEADADGALFVLVQAGPEFARYAPIMCSELGRPLGADMLAKAMYPAVLARYHARLHADQGDRSQAPLAGLIAASENSDDDEEEPERPDEALARMERENFVLGRTGDPTLDLDDRVTLGGATRALAVFLTKVLNTPKLRSDWLNEFEELPGLAVMLAMVGVPPEGKSDVPEEELIQRLAQWRDILHEESPLDCNDLGMELGLIRAQAEAFRRLAGLNERDRWIILHNAPGLGAAFFEVLGDDQLFRMFIELRNVVPADYGEEWLCMFFVSNVEALRNKAEDPKYVERLKAVIRQVADNANVSGTTKLPMPDLQALLAPRLMQVIVEETQTPAEATSRMEKLGKISEAIATASGSDKSNWENVLQLLGYGASRTYMGDVLQELAATYLKESNEDASKRKLNAVMRAMAAVSALERVKAIYGESNPTEVARIVKSSEDKLLNGDRELAAYFISEQLAVAAAAVPGKPDREALIEAHKAFVRLDTGFNEVVVEPSGDSWILTHKGDTDWKRFLPGYDALKVFKLWALNGVRPDMDELLWAAVDVISFLPMAGGALKLAGGALKGGLTLAKMGGQGAWKACSSLSKRGFQMLTKDGWKAGRSLVANGRRALVSLRREGLRESASRMTKAVGKTAAKASKKASQVLTKAALGRAGKTSGRFVKVAAGEAASVLRRTGGSVIRSLSGANLKQLTAEGFKVLMRAAGRALGAGARWLGRMAIKFGTPLLAVTFLKLTVKNSTLLTSLFQELAGAIGRFGDELRTAVEDFFKGIKNLVDSWTDGWPDFAKTALWWGIGALGVILALSLGFGLVGAWRAARTTLALPWRSLTWLALLLGCVGWGAFALVRWVKGLFAKRSEGDPALSDNRERRKPVRVLLLGASKAGKTCTLAALRRMVEVDGSAAHGLASLYVADDNPIAQAQAQIYEQLDWPHGTSEDHDDNTLSVHFKLQDQTVSISDAAGKNVDQVLDDVGREKATAFKSKVAARLKKSMREADLIWIVLSGSKVAKDMGDQRAHAMAAAIGQVDSSSSSVGAWARTVGEFLGSADAKPRVLVSVTKRDIFETDDQKNAARKHVMEAFQKALKNSGVVPVVELVQTVDDFETVTDKDKQHKKPKVGSRPGSGIRETAKHLSACIKEVVGSRGRRRWQMGSAAMAGIALLVTLGLGSWFATPVLAEMAGLRADEEEQQREQLKYVADVFDQKYAKTGVSTPIRRFLTLADMEERMQDEQWLTSIQPDVDTLLAKLRTAKAEAEQDLIAKAPPPYDASVGLPGYLSYKQETGKPGDAIEELAVRLKRLAPLDAIAVAKFELTERRDASAADKQKIEHALVESIKGATRRYENKFKRFGKFGEVARVYSRVAAEPNSRKIAGTALAGLPDADRSEHFCRAADELALVLTEQSNELKRVTAPGEIAIYDSAAEGFSERWGPELNEALTRFYSECVNQLTQSAKTMWSELQRFAYVKARGEWISINEKRSKTKTLDDAEGKAKLILELQSLEESLRMTVELGKRGLPDCHAATLERCEEMQRWLRVAKNAYGTEFSLALTGWEIGNWSTTVFGQAGDDGDDEGYLAVLFSWGGKPTTMFDWHMFAEDDHYKGTGNTLFKTGWGLGFRTSFGRLSRGNTGSARDSKTLLTKDAWFDGIEFSPFVQLDVVIEHDESGRYVDFIQKFDDGWLAFAAQPDEKTGKKGAAIPDYGDFYRYFGWSQEKSSAIGKDCRHGSITIHNIGNPKEESRIWMISTLPTPPQPRGAKYWEDAHDIKKWLPEYDHLGHSFK